MNKFLYIFLIVFISFTSFVKAQDIHFTQFYASSIYLNPAFTGAGVCSRVSTSYRTQWTGVSEAYSSYLASYDHYIKRHNLGVGFMLGRDVSGSGDLARTLIYPMLAYETRITRELGIRFGLQSGVGISSINFNKLVFGDQIARGGNVPTLEDPTQSVYYLDLGAGVLAYSSKYWLGFSAHHLNKPNESLIEPNESILPIKYSVHGGYKFLLQDDDEKSISAAFNYRGQQKFDQLDIGAYYTQKALNIGLWYRGIPLLKSYQPGYSNHDAIAIIFGVKTDVMSFGYSYDFTISRLSNSDSHGSHEISLSYQFCSLKNQKGRRILVECPSF